MTFNAECDLTICRGYKRIFHLPLFNSALYIVQYSHDMKETSRMSSPRAYARCKSRRKVTRRSRGSFFLAAAVVRGQSVFVRSLIFSYVCTNIFARISLENESCNIVSNRKLCVRCGFETTVIFHLSDLGVSRPPRSIFRFYDEDGLSSHDFPSRDVVREAFDTPR